MTTNKLILDYIYEHETERPQQVFMTQPVGKGATVHYTWGEAMGQARRMATYLKAQGFEPGARIAILSKNCAHFIMAELAIWLAGYTTVAIFPTETASTVKFVLEHSGAKLLFVGKLDTWEQQQAGVAPSMPCVALPLALANLSLPKWDDVIKKTPPLTGKVHRAPTDLCFLMYTSGSTGTPKGVMHSFEGATISGNGLFNYLTKNLGPKTPVRVLSYLPLAHIFERVVLEITSFIAGTVHIFFAESLDTFVHDLQRARPTVFMSVPRLWLKFQHGVLEKMPASKLDVLMSLPVIGSVVKKKVLQGLGLDKVKLAVSGSAPIPSDLIDWYARLGLRVMEAYGMTENSAYSHLSTPDKSIPGCVGVPMPGVKCRISDEGEILVKSPGQMVGYYHRPDLDKEALTEDGYFRTGDKGEQGPDGMLKITGRIKEMFKTAKGKYVSPAPIENKFNVHPLIDTAMVSGVGQASAYALVVLSVNTASTLSSPATRAVTEKALVELLRTINKDLPDYEKLKMIVVYPGTWTIENGMLTPTMKIRRSTIEEAVQFDVSGWYAEDKKIIWS